MSRYDAAVARFDAVHREDPRAVDVAGSAVPVSIRYHQRMAAWLDELDPDASEALRLAVRCQHLRRWAVPRQDYPAGGAGYKRWRVALALRHADEAEVMLRDVGYGDDVVERVRALLLKKGLRHDPEVQLLEDVACLVFLETELAAFAPRHDDAKLVDILRKTWGKMSPRGHAAAMALAARLPPDLAALVGRAIREA